LTNGIVTVNLVSQVNCGPGPYQYQIVGPSPSPNTVTSAVTSSTAYTFPNLAAGTYQINVLENGLACVSSTQSVFQPLALVATPTINLNSATVTVNGGTTGGCGNPCRGYNVLWTGGNPPMSGGSLNACPPEIITCSQSSINNTYSMSNLSPGTYTITIEDINNCTVSDTFIVNNASIDGNELSEITLLPNPAMDKLTIRGGAGSLAQHSFFVQDCYGRIVAGGSFESDEATVSVEHLAPGLYYLHIGLNSISFVVIH